MKLDREMIADMVRVKELEAMLAMQLIRNREEVTEILSAEYEIEVTRK